MGKTQNMRLRGEGGFTVQNGKVKFRATAKYKNHTKRITAYGISEQEAPAKYKKAEQHLLTSNHFQVITTITQRDLLYVIFYYFERI